MPLFVVDRCLTQDITAHLSIIGFAPAEVGRLQTLSSISIYHKNDEGHPETVVPQESRVRPHGRKLEHAFRHESVTVIELRKKN